MNAFATAKTNGRLARTGRLVGHAESRQTPDPCGFGDRGHRSTLDGWMSQDPAGYVDGMNVFQFVDARPLTLNDPSGLAPEEDGVFGKPILVVKNEFAFNDNDKLLTEPAFANLAEVAQKNLNAMPQYEGAFQFAPTEKVGIWQASNTKNFQGNRASTVTATHYLFYYCLPVCSPKLGKEALTLSTTELLTISPAYINEKREWTHGDPFPDKKGIVRQKKVMTQYDAKAKTGTWMLVALKNPTDQFDKMLIYVDAPGFPNVVSSGNLSKKTAFYYDLRVKIEVTAGQKPSVVDGAFVQVGADENGKAIAGGGQFEDPDEWKWPK